MQAASARMRRALCGAWCVVKEGEIGVMGRVCDLLIFMPVAQHGGRCLARRQLFSKLADQTVAFVGLLGRFCGCERALPFSIPVEMGRVAPFNTR